MFGGVGLRLVTRVSIGARMYGYRFLVKYR